MPNLKTTLQKLVAQAKIRGLSQLSEEHVQGSYTLKVLEALGWNGGGWIINSSQAHTGKRPDIVLKDAKGWTMLVIESKDCKGQNKLDGYDTVRGKKRTYQEQVINYCKAEGVYWGVLTNFIEWRLYNAHRGILYPQNKKYAFHDLLWDGADKREYTDLLSKDGLEFLSQYTRIPLCKKLGKLDEAPVYYPEEKQVRDDFFSRIKIWREALRDELWKHNQHLITDKEKVELYTQKILDRMIFMDVCHDKRIVGPDGHRAILYAQDSVFVQLREWFANMDELFNTDLFAQDNIIDKLVIRNEVLSPIVEELSGIDFSLLPVRIIGDVYEDYLGEMLRGGKIQGLQVQDDKARGKRKSQGIYYTPEYIVDYITANTVGVLLNPSPAGGDLTPAPSRCGKGCMSFVDIKKIKALDPACGSGSFLINAFDKFYQAYKKAGVVAKIGDFAVKKTILQHNLYGVDLDERAVEICKLNLMLKALDGAKWEELKGRKLLPSLELNIRCGNSLISGKSFADKAKEKRQTELGFYEPYKADKDVIGLLNLRKKFYKAKEDGEKKALLAQIKRDEEIINGNLNDNLRKSFARPSEQKPLNFEVVFPEVFAQGGFDAVIGNPPYGNLLDYSQEEYLRGRLKGFQAVKDVYVAFYERSIELMKVKGYCGFITPIAIASGPAYYSVRKVILDSTNIVKIINLPFDIFKDAYIDAGILILNKGTKGVTKTYVYDKKVTIEKIEDRALAWEIHDQTKWAVKQDNKFELNIAIEQMLDKMKCTSKLVLGDVCDVKRGILFENEKRVKLNTKGSIPAFEGSVYRYECIEKEFESAFIFGPDLKECPKEDIWFKGKRILLRRLVNRQKRLMAALVTTNYIVKKDLYVILAKNNMKYEFILGVINSRLYSHLYIQRISTATKDDYPQVTITDLKALPFCYEKGISEKITVLVKEMLTLYKTPASRERNTIRIAAVDKQIDELVYRLYGLSEAEKNVVEGV